MTTHLDTDFESRSPDFTSEEQQFFLCENDLNNTRIFKSPWKILSDVSCFSRKRSVFAQFC